MSIFITGPIRINGSMVVDGGLPTVLPNVWSMIGASTSTGAAISSYGDLYTWGTSSLGQQGQNDRVHRSSPTQIGGQYWTKLVGGRLHILALRSDGSLWSWGSNFNGQLGLGDKIHRSSPVQVGTSSWNAIAATLSGSMAVRADGTLWEWGQAASLVATFNLTSSPVQIGTATDWLNAKFMDNGSTYPPFGNIFMGAIKTDGSLWMWGDGNYTADVPQDEPGIVYEPKQVGTSSWMSIGSAAGFVVAAIRSDGALFTWGEDDITRLDYVGDGIVRSSPVQIGTSSWTMVVGGTLNGMFAAIRADGTLHTWGYDSAGTLGINSITSGQADSPTQILSSNSWTMMYIGGSSVYALATDNTVWAWGLGSPGRNGDNTNISRSSPVQVALPPLVTP